MRRTILIIQFILLFVFTGLFLYAQRHGEALVTAISILFALLPVLIQEIYKIKLPTYVLWILPALFVINAIAVYFLWPNNIPHFDKLLHLCGGAILVMLFYTTVRAHELTRRNHKVFLLLFAIALAVSFGAFWEIYEWIIIQIEPFFIMTLKDSIFDLLADTLGAIAVATIYYLK